MVVTAKDIRLGVLVYTAMTTITYTVTIAVDSTLCSLNAVVLMTYCA
jgi:hypothetical protein